MNPYDDILLYWSDELDAPERLAVEERLRQNPQAAAYLAELEDLGDSLKHLPTAEPKRPLARETVLEVVRHPQRAKVTAFPNWARLSAIAALAMGSIALGAHFLQQPSAEEPDTTAIVIEPTPTLPSRAQSPTTKAPPRVSNRLFAKESRFTSNARLQNARKRASKIRTRLPIKSI